MMKDLKIQYSREADAWDGWEQPYIFMRVERKEDFIFIQEAVKKQQPMKPLLVEETHDDGDEYYLAFKCPSCGNHTDHPFRPNYCRTCGQKLEWGEE